MIIDKPNDINNLEIVYPNSCTEQAKLVSMMQLIEKKIFNNQSQMRVLKKYKEGLQRILLLSDKSKSEKRLKELVIFSPKSNLSAGASDSNAPYPFYLSGDKIGKIHCYQLDGCYVIANDGGEAGFRLTKGKFSYSDHCICFKANEDYITRNLYEYLDSIKKRVTYAGFVGSGLKNIDRDYLRNLKIPDSINSKAISRLFELINGMIDNLNSEMLALKSCKNFFLRNMFI